MSDPIVWLALFVGYALGSVPFGLVLTRLAGTQDLRSVGSGNIGATNVLRTGRKGLAAATLLLDALKGTVAVLIGKYFGPEAAAVAGLGAFLGHLYPVWLKFSGGKGVATFIGILLGLAPIVALVFAVVWLAAAFMTRYSSLAALLACVVAPVAMYFQDDQLSAILIGFLTVLVFWKHRPNIKRLINGTESKIGQTA